MNCVELKFYAVGRRRQIRSNAEGILAAFAGKRLGVHYPILYPRRRLLGASPHSVGVYSHAILFSALTTFGVNRMTFTAIYQQAAEGGYMGFIAELPGAIAQGETPEETRENLHEAAALVLVT